LQVNIPNEWEWLSDPKKLYSVHDAYLVPSSPTETERNFHCDLIWNKLAPIKVPTIAWPLFCDRLLTKYNLFVRGCLRNDSILCQGGCNDVEDVHHLFFKCPLSGVVWYGIISWLMIQCILPNNATAFASHFCGVHEFCKSSRNYLQVIWLTMVWFLWKERNNWVFNNKVFPVDTLIYNISKLTCGGGWRSEEKKVFISIYRIDRPMCVFVCKICVHTS
jgi:hypothetical protein